jgi:hypothetical protein
MMKQIDAREARDRIDEYKTLIVNDNCSLSGGIEVLLDREKDARRLSVYTSLLGYENRVESVGDYWALIVEIGPCVCPVGL